MEVTSLVKVFLKLEEGSYNCSNGMSLGQGICIAGGGSYNCSSGMKYAQGVCIAGGGASYECNSGMTLGAAVCMSGGHSSYECLGISNNDLGEGICRAAPARNAQACKSIKPSAVSQETAKGTTQHLSPFPWWKHAGLKSCTTASNRADRTVDLDILSVLSCA